MSWKLSWKLAAVVTLGIAAVHAVFGYIGVRRELSELEQEAARYHAAMAHVLGVAVQSTAAHSGLDEALRLLRDADQRTDQAQLRWLEVPAGSTSSASARPSWSIDESARPIVLTSSIPLSIAGRAGIIQIREKLTAEEAYVRGAVASVFATTFALVVLCFAILAAAGWYFLHRPIHTLMAKVARIGAGDLSTPLAMPQRDELGTLGDALDVMCDRLSALQASSEHESRAKIAALDQLRHADRLTTVGKLASGLAHELGTPLHVVSARGQMIARRESEGDEAVEDAEVIVAQTERMTGIIRQLLDFARRRKPARTLEDLVAICRHALSFLEPLARRAAVTVELVEGPAQLMAEVDAVQLQQVITNLVMNAIQAQPDGGAVRLYVRSVSGAQPALVIVVEDDGPGIPVEARERLFEPFFTTKEIGQGTGLGLSVAYGIMQEHGGHIDVDTAPGRGSRFSIHLPHGTP